MSQRTVLEDLLAEQLTEASIPFEREIMAIPGRRFRFDFRIGDALLVEVEGGAFVGGRHVQGAGFEKDCEKYSLATVAGFKLIRCTGRHVKSGQALEWIRGAINEEEHVA